MSCVDPSPPAADPEAEPVTVAVTPPKALDPAADDIVAKWRESGELAEPQSTLPEVSRWQQMEAIANRIARSNLVPKHIRDARDPEADCLVTLIMAHDLGISMTLAFQKTAVIEGKPSQMSELMRILAVRDGHRVRYEVTKDDVGRAVAAKCLVARKDDPENWIEAEFTLEDAVVAGLCTIDDKTGNPRARDSNGKPKPWERYTEDMLIARCTSRCMRRACPDSLGGVSYTPEELGAVEVVGGDDYTYATQSTLDALRAKIAALPDDDARRRVATLWKEKRLGKLVDDGGKMRMLIADEILTANAIIEEVERDAPVDVEIVGELDDRHVFEGPDSSNECATCGKARDDVLHSCLDCGHPWAEHARAGGCLVVLHDGVGTATGSCPCTEPGIAEPVDEPEPAPSGVEVGREALEPTETTEDPTAAVGPSKPPEGETDDPASDPPAAAGGTPGPESGQIERVLSNSRGPARVAEVEIEVEILDPWQMSVAALASGATSEIQRTRVQVPYKGDPVAVGMHVAFTLKGEPQQTGTVTGDYRKGDEPF